MTTPKIDPNASQVGGAHYQGDYQHWDFVREALNGRYLEGCATKYVSRWRKKNGLQDLKKAAHYVEKIIHLHEAGLYEPMGVAGCTRLDAVGRFSESAELQYEEILFIEQLASWVDIGVLRDAQLHLNILIDEATLTQ